MAADDNNPFFLPAHDVTLRASVGVTGCRFVDLDPALNEVEGLAQTRHCPAATKAFGVSARTTPAGGNVMAFRDGVVEVTTTGAVGHGDGVEVGADGTAVVLAAGVRVGTCMADAAGGAKAKIALELT